VCIYIYIFRPRFVVVILRRGRWPGFGDEGLTGDEPTRALSGGGTGE
jgi:hypothetical protein